MPFLSLNQLPTELHALILDFLLSCSNPRRKARPIVGFTHRSEVRSSTSSSFPYNAALTCKLWRDLLSQRPECWTQVAFDVSQDPTPLMDVFLWTDQGAVDPITIEVLVFNSAETPEEVDKATERRHVAAITAILLPHVNRCLRIVFDIMFSSSLPPPDFFYRLDAPILVELNLDCQVDDIDTHEYPDPSQREKIQDGHRWPSLVELSLTGFWFLHLALHLNNPSQLLAGSNPLSIDLRLSAFTFLEEGQYTLRNLLECLGGMDELQTIHFDRLMLSHAPFDSDVLPSYPHVFQSEHLTLGFSSVSKDLLVQLNQLLPDTTPQAKISSLSFRKCEIPSIDRLPNSSHLVFTDVFDDQLGTGLRNVIASRSGRTIQVIRCHGFSDAFLEWFGEPAEPTREGSLLDLLRLRAFPAYGLMMVRVIDCQNFSSASLRNFIERRHNGLYEMAQSEPDPSLREDFVRNQMIRVVDVQGQVAPVLGEDDRVWLRQNIQTFRWSRDPT